MKFRKKVQKIFDKDFQDKNELSIKIDFNKYI